MIATHSVCSGSWVACSGLSAIGSPSVQGQTKVIALRNRSFQPVVTRSQAALATWCMHNVPNNAGRGLSLGTKFIGCTTIVQARNCNNIIASQLLARNANS